MCLFASDVRDRNAKVGRELSIALGIALVAAVPVEAANAHEVTVSSPVASPIEPARQTFEEEAWAKERAHLIASHLADEAVLQDTKVLFLGDSITEFWTTHGLREWNKGFGKSDEFRGLNLGFAGDRTENLLLHLASKADGGDGYLANPALAPEIIVLMVGVNNTWNTEPPVVEKIVAGNLAIIARLRQLRPEATVLVQSLLPAENSWRSQNIIVPINRQLEGLVRGLGPKVQWFDAYSLFAQRDGTPNPELFVDTVHPSGAGYEIWRPALTGRLEEISELDGR